PGDGRRPGPLGRRGGRGLAAARPRPLRGGAAGGRRPAEPGHRPRRGDRPAGRPGTVGAGAAPRAGPAGTGGRQALGAAQGGGPGEAGPDSGPEPQDRKEVERTTEAVCRAVAALGLRHGLVPPYTSLVAVARSGSAPAGTAPVRSMVPVALPGSWNESGVEE